MVACGAWYDRRPKRFSIPLRLLVAGELGEAVEEARETDSA